MIVLWFIYISLYFYAYFRKKFFNIKIQIFNLVLIKNNFKIKNLNSFSIPKHPQNTEFYITKKKDFELIRIL